MSDHSSLLARLSANIEILRELDPLGKWQHSPILLAYLREPYSLKLSQANELDMLLTEAVKECEISKKYLQLSLLEGEMNP